MPSPRNDTMICSFHKLLQVEKIAVSAWHLLQRPIPRPDRSLVLPWQKTLPMQSSVCRLGDAVEYVLSCYVYHCASIRYISIKVPSGRLRRSPWHNASAGLPSLTTTVSAGLVTAKSLSQFFKFSIAYAVGCLPPYLMVLCGCRHPSFLGLALVERRPHYFVPGVIGREGCLRHAFPKTPPPLTRKIG